MEPHVSARMQLLTGECCHFRAGFGYADRVVLNSRSSLKQKYSPLNFDVPSFGLDRDLYDALSAEASICGDKWHLL